MVPSNVIKKFVSTLRLHFLRRPLSERTICLAYPASELVVGRSE